tara:strand:+ start:523 stop:750 length:228 start_codon:yes stop_codon:yes gene_type:complete
MCDLCKSKGLKKEQLNGIKSSRTYQIILNQVFVGKSVEITLCYLHDIELFKKGERRFVSNNLELMPLLWSAKVAV